MSQLSACVYEFASIYKYIFLGIVYLDKEKTKTTIYQLISRINLLKVVLVYFKMKLIHNYCEGENLYHRLKNNFVITEQMKSYKD